MADTVRLKIKRQENPQTKPYWEEFEVPYHKNMNVISALMEIQLNPVNAKGEEAIPVAWDCSCLEEVCGACSMIINNEARQACTAIVEHLEQPITLEPLTKFPIICDLMVDRKVMFDYLKKVKAWVDVDGYYFNNSNLKMTDKVRRFAYDLSRCMTCGCCMESCPNVNEKSPFMGPAIIGQVRLFTLHPTGEANQDEKLAAITNNSGVGGCGNAQNCIEVCPKSIPLRRAIGEMNCLTFSNAVKKWLKAD